MNREQLITRVKSVIYQNDNNEIDAQKHQDLEIEIINTLLDAVGSVSSGFIGTIQANAPAPTPQKNGYYIFSTAGTIPYIPGSPTVKVGDWLVVTYVGLIHTYSNVGKLLNLSDDYTISDGNVGASLKALFDGLKNLSTTLSGGSTLTVKDLNDKITASNTRLDGLDLSVKNIGRWCNIVANESSSNARLRIVPALRRKGFQLERLGTDSVFVTEKYIGSTLDDSEWSKDSNWIEFETKNNKNKAGGYVGLDNNTLMQDNQIPNSVERVSKKNLPNGYPGLDSDGKIDNRQLRRTNGYYSPSLSAPIRIDHNDKLNVGTADFTIECSFNFRQGAGTLLKKGDDVITKTTLFINASNVLQLHLIGSGITNPVLNLTTLTKGLDYHCIVTRVGRLINTYINGELASTYEVPEMDLSSTVPIYVGSSGLLFSIYSLRQFNRGFSQLDVDYYYNNGQTDRTRLTYQDKTNCVLELLPENATPTKWLGTQNNIDGITSGNPTINYGNFYKKEVPVIDEPSFIEFEKTGDGTGVASITINCYTSNVATIMGGTFYTDATGTTSLGSTVQLFAGISKVLCWKATSPYGTIKLSNIDSFSSILEPANSPEIISSVLDINTRSQFGGVSYGNNMISGDVRDLNRNLIKLEMGGMSSFFGNIRDLPRKITSIILGSYSAQVTGIFKNLPRQLSSVIIYSGQIGGDISGIPSLANAIILTKSTSGGTQYSYTAGHVFAASFNTLNIRPYATGEITSTMVDNIFIDLNNSVTTAIGSKTLDLRGNCAAPTAASLTARTELAAKGFAILIN